MSIFTTRFFYRRNIIFGSPGRMRSSIGCTGRVAVHEKTNRIHVICILQQNGETMFLQKEISIGQICPEIHGCIPLALILNKFQIARIHLGPGLQLQSHEQNEKDKEPFIQSVLF